MARQSNLRGISVDFRDSTLSTRVGVSKVPSVRMASLPRILLVLALAIQAVLGSAHLSLEVCHREVQSPASDGASCCFAEHCDAADNDAQPDGPLAEGNECSECYDLEIVGVDDPIEVVDSGDPPAHSESVAAVVSERPSKPPGRSWCARVTRGPPDALTPTGLLPGVFPLRI